MSQNVVVKMDFKPVANMLKMKGEKFTRQAQKEMNQAGFFFIGQMVKKWYSGRNSDDTGLNRQSGFLADRWSVSTNVIDGEAITKMQSGVLYGEKHEKGVKSENLPRRTFLTDDINTIGKEFFMDAVKKASKEF